VTFGPYAGNVHSL